LHWEYGKLSYTKEAFVAGMKESESEMAEDTVRRNQIRKQPCIRLHHFGGMGSY
jgi:hypothetical protein